MESTDKPTTPPPKSDEAPPPPPPAIRRVNCFVVDVALRVLLFAATLVAVVVMVTSKETEFVPVPPTGAMMRRTAKFNHSPAFIYFVTALSVACLYSIITTLASFSTILKPAFSKKFLLHFAFWDVLIFGVVASALGTAGGVAYIGYKGNSHVGWTKVCPNYDKFCDYIISSLAMSLLASIVLVLLIFLSIFSLYKRARD
ncbi:hypothetical protein Patl1_25584 [Pistacia atlantica]|uniref:Uncharacterized protein n=1 Tax=Pistacia atlantica TaxID=434234 RepID=A0ACC1B244_9ROSI|nr:hypothetical protein Patl1_25584 [Pistacia atlantica]